jgi:hypothetical protein
MDGAQFGRCVEQKDIVVAVFGAAVGLAGILLVFVGFVYAHAETIDLANTRKKLKIVAKVGIIPFLVSLLCTSLSLNWMLHSSSGLFCWVCRSFWASIGLTGLYGTIAFLLYL